MTSKVIRTVAAATIALCAVTPAFAACNPGTPHCIPVSPTLAKVKGQLFNPGTLGSGEQDCQNSKLCGIDTGDGTSPGALARTQTTPSIPIPPPSSIQVR
ncbi:MAG TPA: hypothetical protein VJ747_06765 [Stellaceae bacterium]|nr:hypothetical protein [Stellaceae bacterium]